MNNVITNPCYDNFMELCSNASKSIKLCAPYVKSDVIADVLLNKLPETSVSLITRINLRDYHSKVSDIESLRQTLLYGGHVYNCSNLHCKNQHF